MMFKRAFMMASVLMLSTLGTIASLTKELTPSVSIDTIKVYKDSVQIVYNPDTVKTRLQLKRAAGFSYSNSYVPNSVSISTSKAVGQIDIQSGISPSGAKTYTVPINVYHSEGVFCPNISLNYNSQAGSSSYGKGWSIGGLQSIVRGNKSIYFDGKTEGMKMNADDAFYLNGVRLIRMSANEYETEQGQIKVKPIVSGNVVRYFNVYYPNGYTAIFGITTDTSNRLEYPITSLTDERGRTINFSYIQEGANYHISNIWYDDQRANIRFTYNQMKADYVQGYRGGLSLDNIYLLQSITCLVNSSEIGKYTMIYTTDANTSLLQQIDYSANGSSLNPLKFYYGDNSAQQEYEVQEAILNSGYTYSNRSLISTIRGRFEYMTGNDGLIVYPQKNPYYLKTRNSDLFHHSQRYLENQNNADDDAFVYPELSPSTPLNVNYKVKLESNFIEFLSADIDGNQQESIIKVNNGYSGEDDIVTFKVYTKTALGLLLRYTRTFSYSTVHTDNDGNKSIKPKYYYTGDFNGDGIMEVMAMTAANPFGGSNSPSTCYVYDLKNGTTLYSTNLLDFRARLTGNNVLPIDAETYSDKLFSIDYNGDGKTDLCHINPSGTHIYEFNQNGSSWSAQKVTTYTGLTLPDLVNRCFYTGDYNGDGLTDILVSGNKGSSGNCIWTFYFSTGDGTFIAISSDHGPNTFNTTSDFLSQDIDGDGVTDIVELTDTSFRSYMVKNNTITPGTIQSLSKNNAFLVPVSINSTSLSAQFISLYGYKATLYSYMTDCKTDQALTGAANSLGVVEKNYYYSISNRDFGIYSSGSYAKFPYCNIYENIPVVAGDEVFATSGAKNQYQYYNAVIHRQGLGFCGFETIKTTNKRGQMSIATYEPYNHSVLKQIDTPTSTITYTNSVQTDSYKRLRNSVRQKTTYNKLKAFTETTTYTYNVYGQIVLEQITFPGNISVEKKHSYDNFDNNSKYRLGRLVYSTVTTNRGGNLHSEKTTISSYNTVDQPLTIINEVNGHTTNTTTLSYDINGNITSKSVYPYTSSTALTTTYQWTTGNRLTRETDPLGVWKSYTYNSDGTIQKINSYTGATKYTYDAFRRLIKEEQPDGTETNISYTWDTGVSGCYTITKSGNTIPTISTIYNTLNKEVYIYQTRFNGDQIRIIKSYDAYGNQSQEAYPQKSSSPPVFKKYTYDTFDRLIKKEENGKTTTISYNGLNTTINDGTMSSTTTTDALGGVISISDNAGTISYTLNASGNPTVISAPAESGNITTTITYDNYGRRKSIDDPSHGTTSYTYHSTEGYLTKEINARNQETSYEYDSYRRLTKKTTPEFYTIYTYDNNLNNIIAETSSNGTSTTYTYDNYGRLSSMRENAVDNKWLQKDYTYSNDRVSTIGYTSQNGNITTENFYYSRGYLSSVKLNGVIPIFNLNSEDLYGHTSSVSTMGLTRIYNINIKGQPLSRSVKYGSQTIQNLNYTYDSASEDLTSRYNLQNGLTENFVYDDLHRLKEYGGTTVTYDDNGNIKNKGDIGLFEYDASKPYAVSEITLNNPIAVGTQNINYYSFDRPSMISDNGYTANFVYNGNYDRVKMQLLHNSIPTLTRYYLGGCYEMDITPSGTTEKLYINGDYYDSPVVLVKQGSSIAYYNILRDHIGSITHVVTPSGTVVQELSYDAWGRLRNPANYTRYTPTNEPELFFGRGYCGHEHLTGLGLINMNARLYDPLLGRFLSSDPRLNYPYMSQAYNRYTYGFNNPISTIDRNGESVIFVLGMLAGAYLGGVLANSGNPNKWNPLKWNYNSLGTFLGIIGGGCFVGAAVNAIAIGELSLTFKLATPLFSVGFDYYNSKEGLSNIDYIIDTPMGGHWNSGEEEAVSNAGMAYDKAVSSMGERYWRGVERNLETNPQLNNIYTGMRYGLDAGINGLEYIQKKSSTPKVYSPSINGMRFINYNYQLEELLRDYIKEGGAGENFKRDLYIDLGNIAGSSIGKKLGSYIGSRSTFLGATIGPLFFEYRIRKNDMDERLRMIQPTNGGWDGYYNFMYTY